MSASLRKSGPSTRVGSKLVLPRLRATAYSSVTARRWTITVSIEPGGCPTGDLKPYVKIPMLVLFGDYVDQSPRWAPRLKQCREYADAIRKMGGKTELIVLPEIGIKGNSHMLMQDKNSLELAAWLVSWLNKNVEMKKP